MPIQLPSPPTSTRRVASFAVKRLSGQSFSEYSQLKRAQFTSPVRVYRIKSEDFGLPKPLKSATPANWKCLIVDGDRPVAAVEFAGEQVSEDDLKFIVTGNWVDAAIKAITLLESQAIVERESFEVRILDLQPIQMEAVWLSGSGTDLLVPLEPLQGEFKEGIVYKSDDFFSSVSKLHERCVRRLKELQEKPKQPRQVSAESGSTVTGLCLWVVI